MIRETLVALLPLLSPRAAHAKDARPIVDAITVAAEEDCKHGYIDCAYEAVTMLEWAWYESELSTNPTPRSWDAKALVSCGAWQEPCGFVQTHSLTDQARYWLMLAHDAARVCPNDPLSRVAGGCHRAAAEHEVARRARRLEVVLLGLQRAEGVAQRQAL